MHKYTLLRPSTMTNTAARLQVGQEHLWYCYEHFSHIT